MKEILGKKLGMTQVFRENGEVVPVTVIEAGPCYVVQVKTIEKDGYSAIQVGFGEQKESRFNKPSKKRFENANVKPTRYLREIKFDESELEAGAEIKADIFKEGERVDVTGISRGLGFSGTMKRHHFSGGDKTHGQSDRWRAPGSIGQSSDPSRVFKGMKMSGRMGKDKVTVLNLEVVKVIPDENLILVKGPVPGFNGSLLKIRNSNRR